MASQIAGVDDQVTRTDDQVAQIEALAVQAESEDYQPEPDALTGEVHSEEPEMETGELIAALMSIGGEVAASRKGEHWRFNEAECRETGQAVGAVIDKYFPDFSNNGPEIKAVLCVSMVVMPRFAMDRAIQGEKAKQNTDKGNTQQQAEEDATAKEVTSGD